MIWWIAAFILPFGQQLENPVLSPGNVCFHQHFDAPCTWHALGARVDPLSSQGIWNGWNMDYVESHPAKLNEVWAQAGLDPAQFKSRITRLKRAFVRAFKHSLTQGVSMYKGKPLYPRDVPWHIRQAWQYQ